MLYNIEYRVGDNWLLYGVYNVPYNEAMQHALRLLKQYSQVRLTRDGDTAVSLNNYDIR